MFVFALLSSLLPLAIVTAIVVTIARVVRGNEVDWGQLVRQFFQHLIALSLAFVAAWGVSGLAMLAVQGPSLLRTDDQLAGPVAFAVVGVPLYAAMMWWLLGQARRDEREARTLAWSLHLLIVGVTALTVSMLAVFDVVDRLVDGDGDALVPVATLVVWGGLWAWYRWLGHHRVGAPRWGVLQVIAGSAIGLSTLVGGAVVLLRDALQALVVPGTGLVAIEQPWGAVTGVLVGAGVWGLYWLRDGMRRPRDGWWQGWVLLGGVFTGLVVMTGAAGYLLWLVAVWLVGDPAAGAIEHFEDLPDALALLAAGAAVWAYHRSILAPRSERSRGEVDRVYDLLLSAVGLAAAAGGFATILVAILEVLAGPGTVEVGGSPVNTLLAAVTFLVVGVPLWWRAWGRMQRLAGSRPLGMGGVEVELDEAQSAERRSVTRRVYLFLLFGVGGLVALVAVLVAVVDGFEDLFAGDLGAGTLYSMRVALAVLVTSGAVAALHWRVYREDRDLVTEAPRRFPARITLVGVADPAIVDALHAVTDARVSLLARTDGPTPPWSVDRLATALDGHADDHVVVLSRPDGPEFIPVGR